jgi:DNA-directed RNA polymerase specialized sigma24 family protein
LAGRAGDEDSSRFVAWLFPIAHSEAYSMFRKRKPESDEEAVPGEGRWRYQVGALILSMLLAITGIDELAV